MVTGESPIDALDTVATTLGTQVIFDCEPVATPMTFVWCLVGRPGAVEPFEE